MNQDQVKDALQRIEPAPADFQVIFTGKSSKKVNGLYKPETREILIHNRNFADDKLLIYTAIHEYAHHVHYTKDPVVAPKARAHTNAFWCIFHGLLAKAETLGIYRDVYGSDSELQEITEGLRGDLREIAVIMKRIGKRLIAAAAICKRINARFEDYVDRVIRMNRVTAKLAMKAFQMDVSEDYGPDGVRLIASAPGEEARIAVESALAAGKSHDEAKAARKSTPPASDEESQVERLQKEKGRIVRTIASLERRLEEVEQELGDVSPDTGELDIEVGGAPD